jgi:hypothetical protein
MLLGQHRNFYHGLIKPDKESQMSGTIVLETPAIEDALFGESKVVRIEDSTDESCLCFCGCKDGTTKATNYLLTGASSSVDDSPVI